MPITGEAEAGPRSGVAEGTAGIRGVRWYVCKNVERSAQ